MGPNLLVYTNISETNNSQNKLTLVLLNPDMLSLASADPDQLASEDAKWPESALFAIKYVNLYLQPGSSNLTGWKLEVGEAS